MKIILAILTAVLLSACAAETFRDDRYFSTKSVFEKHEKNLNVQP